MKTAQPFEADTVLTNDNEKQLKSYGICLWDLKKFANFLCV